MLPMDSAAILLGCGGDRGGRDDGLVDGLPVVGHPTPRKGLADHTPSVTIYKPLKGIDEGLEENLRQLLRSLDYPVYQLIFGVAEADDPAIAVVHRLQRRVSRTATTSWSWARRPSGSARRSRTWRRWTGTASTT